MSSPPGCTLHDSSDSPPPPCIPRADSADHCQAGTPSVGTFHSHTVQAHRDHRPQPLRSRSTREPVAFAINACGSPSQSRSTHTDPHRFRISTVSLYLVKPGPRSTKWSAPVVASTVSAIPHHPASGGSGGRQGWIPAYSFVLPYLVLLQLSI